LPRLGSRVRVSFPAPRIPSHSVRFDPIRVVKPRWAKPVPSTQGLMRKVAQPLSDRIKAPQSTRPLLPTRVGRRCWCMCSVPLGRPNWRVVRNCPASSARAGGASVGVAPFPVKNPPNISACNPAVSPVAVASVRRAAGCARWGACTSLRIPPPARRVRHAVSRCVRFRAS